MFDAILHQGGFVSSSIGSAYCNRSFVLADYLLDSIDKSANPCEDFYQFTCGTWLKTARIPEESKLTTRTTIDCRRTSNGRVLFSWRSKYLQSIGFTIGYEYHRSDERHTSTELSHRMLLLLFLLTCTDLLSAMPTSRTVEPNAVINARRLYQSCLNESNIEIDGVEPILDIINNEFGGWPILEGTMWNDATYNLTNLLLQLRKYDNGMIYSVGTATNQENSSIYDIEVSIACCACEHAEIAMERSTRT
jgi:neprilysin